MNWTMIQWHLNLRKPPGGTWWLRLPSWMALPFAPVMAVAPSQWMQMPSRAVKTWVLWDQALLWAQPAVDAGVTDFDSNHSEQSTSDNHKLPLLPFAWLFLMISHDLSWSLYLGVYCGDAIYTQKLSAQLNDDSWLLATVLPAHRQWLHNGVPWITVSYCVKVGPATELKVCNGNATGKFGPSAHATSQLHGVRPSTIIKLFV